MFNSVDILLKCYSICQDDTKKCCKPSIKAHKQFKIAGSCQEAEQYPNGCMCPSAVKMTRISKIH